MARSVIALCTPSVSQTAYPTEKRNASGAAIRFSLPNPNGRPSQSCPRPLRRTHRLCFKILDYCRIPTTQPTCRPPLLRFFRWLGCWLALTGCFSHFQKCPGSSLYRPGNCSDQSRNGQEKWAPDSSRFCSVARAKMAFCGGPI